MPPPDVGKPALARTENGLQKSDRLAGSCSSNRTGRPDTQASYLIAELDAARARLDAHTALLNRALDLRELLWCGLDFDDITETFDALKRDALAHRWARRDQ